MTTRRNLLLGLGALALPAAAEAATPAKSSKPAKKAAAKPAAKQKQKLLVITINKVSQKMTVELDGRTKYKWPVSTGAPGYETPSGSFKPFRLEKEHYSKEWDDAPMPHSIFFTTRGHAVHGSYHVKSLGRRASHGCVRLHPDNAAKLFALVSETGMSRTSVVVRGGFFDGGFGEKDNKKKKKKFFPWD